MKTLLYTQIRGYLSEGIKRGEAPLRKTLPSPLHKGRGIKGEGLINTLIITPVRSNDDIIMVTYGKA